VIVRERKKYNVERNRETHRSKKVKKYIYRKKYIQKERRNIERE
jgi:hypothetical protein